VNKNIAFQYNGAKHKTIKLKNNSNVLFFVISFLEQQYLENPSKQIVMLNAQDSLKTTIKN
jgi:hypothetical protein